MSNVSCTIIFRKSTRLLGEVQANITDCSEISLAIATNSFLEAVSLLSNDSCTNSFIVQGEPHPWSACVDDFFSKVCTFSMALVIMSYLLVLMHGICVFAKIAGFEL